MSKSVINEVKRKHPYFQVQVKKYIYSIFVYCSQKVIKIEKIERQDNFWQSEIENKLKRFCFVYLVPEIGDPRLTRNMPIKDSAYILDPKKNSWQK